MSKNYNTIREGVCTVFLKYFSLKSTQGGVLFRGKRRVITLTIGSEIAWLLLCDQLHTFIKTGFSC